MAKRKVTEKDVKEAYKMAEDARQRALYSMRRARQMKDGANVLSKIYRESKKKK